MTITQTLKAAAIECLHSLYASHFKDTDFQVNQTKPEFEGDYTVVLFSLVKNLKKSPEILGNELGTGLINKYPGVFTNFNVIKGFLNLGVSSKFLFQFLDDNYQDTGYGKQPSNGKTVMVEYSSPNTNKPLHLGHLRNNFLGWSVAEILEADGSKVVKSCIVNDRGIHICKSMIAWKHFSNGETPQSTHTKGDHFVGDYYVRFNDAHKKQVEELMNSGLTADAAAKQAPLMEEAQQMLLDWENGKPEVVELWKRMNGWVYEGFNETYKRIGSDFDKTYYESDTYLLGKDLVQEGLKNGILYQKDDGSVWIDLTSDGLDEKLLLRADGTSVYITADLGLADQKYNQYKPGKSIYVIGDEQLYHMKVLKLICKKLGMPFADGIYHLSYGMVELTTGKMKSREGTVVDGDDLVEEMTETAKHHTEELGKVKDFNEVELKELYEILGLGAMKFYVLRVDPKKRMIFNPEDSIDFHGYTGPFIQYTYARIQSILKKIETGKLAFTTAPAGESDEVNHRGGENENLPLTALERELLLLLENYPNMIAEAAAELNPSVVANYVYNLAKTFNSFYTEHSVANAENEEKKQLRIRISGMTTNVIKSSMQLLGIRVPQRM
ncbi:MAG: arginine--tRNA ligase [Ginsengibacter sp.]